MTRRRGDSRRPPWRSDRSQAATSLATERAGRRLLPPQNSSSGWRCDTLILTQGYEALLGVENAIAMMARACLTNDRLRTFDADRSLGSDGD